MDEHDFTAKQPITDPEELYDWLLNKEAIYIAGVWHRCSDARQNSFCWMYRKMLSGELQQSERE